MGQNIKMRYVVLALCLFIKAPACPAEDFQYLPELETVTLKPTMRPEPYSVTLYSIHSDTISKEIENVLLFDSIDQYQALPYVASFEEKRQIAHEGQIAFTKGLSIKDDYSEYTLLKPGVELKHPTTGETLGMQAFVNGSVVVQKFGDPQTVLIKKAFSAIELRARLIPLVGIDLPSILDIKYPPTELKGYILSMGQDYAVGGEYTPVVVSLGVKDGLKQGHVLDILEKQVEVTDPNTRAKIKIPVEKIGEVIIYKVGEKISLGIITYSNRSIAVNDILSVPAPGI